MPSGVLRLLPECRSSLPQSHAPAWIKGEGSKGAGAGAGAGAKDKKEERRKKEVKVKMSRKSEAGEIVMMECKA